MFPISGVALSTSINSIPLTCSWQWICMCLSRLKRLFLAFLFVEIFAQMMQQYCYTVMWKDKKNNSKNQTHNF